MKVLNIAHIDEYEKEMMKMQFPTFEFRSPVRYTQEDIDWADVILGNPSLKYNLNNDHLKALMLNSAGNNQYLDEGILNENTVLTNGSGSYGVAISEHVIGMIIAMNKNFYEYFNNMNTNLWRVNNTGFELYHKKVLIVGVGDIGYAIAKRLKAFDCTITGIKRTVSEVEYFDHIDTLDHIDTYLPTADYIILALPETKETIHLMNEARFRKMKSTALICNVGRGSAIDNDALLKALMHHWIRGAALDVVEGEPIDQTHPLWRMNNVFITPHVSGGYHWDSVKEYYTGLLIRNLHHLENNEPLENEVDRKKGYRINVTYHQ